MTPAFRTYDFCPDGAASPLVFASPHSGRAYPADFLQTLACDVSDIRAIEDGWIDRAAVEAARALRSPLVAAHWGRAYLDLNRAPDELDPLLIESAPARPQSDRIRAGLGILPRLAHKGRPIRRGKMPLAAARARIEAVHAPYHSEIARLLGRARQRHGWAVLVDCHSMPSLTPHGGPAAEVVLGDRHGTSAAKALVERAGEALGRAYRVRQNMPYAGGFTTMHHADPAEGIHAIQVEFDRALYLDPLTLLPNEGFAGIAAALSKLGEALLTVGLPGESLPLAAE